MIRILLLTHGVPEAEALRRMLRRDPGSTVVAWMNAARPCSTTIKPPVDVALLDGSCAQIFSRAGELRAQLPSAKLVLLADSMNPGALAEACRSGIDAVIAKSTSTSSAATLLHEIVRERVFHLVPPPALPGREALRCGLTTREREVLRLAAQGRSNAHIAAELWVTEQTVKFHLSNVYRKLGVSNRTHATHYAHVHHLVDEAHASAPIAVPDAA
jgi:DNA-binding NarL/FixJ family response regulator